MFDAMPADRSLALVPGQLFCGTTSWIGAVSGCTFSALAFENRV
jgi:hypothetical protein